MKKEPWGWNEEKNVAITRKEIKICLKGRKKGKREIKKTKTLRDKECAKKSFLSFGVIWKPLLLAYCQCELQNGHT